MKLVSVKNFLSLTVTAFSLVILFSSCSKEKSGPPAPAVKRVKSFTLNGEVVSSYVYDNKDRLLRFNSKNAWTDYMYPDNGFKTNWYIGGQLKKVSEATEMESGRVRKMNQQSYVNEQPGAASIMQFVYNPDGTVQQYQSGAYAYTYEYQGGNFIKMVQTKNGVADALYTYSYYDTLSAFNLPFFEYFYSFPMLTNGFTGKANKHLMKSCIVLRENSVVTYLFSYKLDAAGYVTSYTETVFDNQKPPVSTEMQVVYQ